MVASPSLGIYANLPNHAPYKALRNWRIELRIHNCTGGGMIVQDDAFQLQTNCKSVTATSLADDSAAATVALPSDSAADVILRVQRILAAHSLAVEIWQARLGKYSQAVLQGPQIWGKVNHSDQILRIGGSAALAIGYLRFFSTVKPLASLPDAEKGDLGDWEFDGTPEDSSGNRIKLHHAAGKLQYVQTPAYPPTVVFQTGAGCFTSAQSAPEFCVVNANATATLSAQAFSASSLPQVTYSWTQTAGPETAHIVNASAPVTDVTGLTKFGEYDFKLNLADGEGNRASSTLSIGVVATSGPRNCLIANVPANLQYLVGPLTQWGSSCDPWPWYDRAEVGNANVLIKTYKKPPTGDTQAPGTLTITQPAGVLTITGTGTSFTKLPHSCDGTGCPSAGGNGGDYGIYLAVWWNAEGGAANGRMILQVPVKGIVSDTVLLPDFGGAFPPVVKLGASYRYSLLDAEDYWAPFSLLSQPSYSWNYYDNVIAFYRLYYRTGITAYLNHARQLADDWWVYALDHGYSTSTYAPRAMSLPGMMARAIDGGFTARWTGIENLAKRNIHIAAVAPGLSDVREEGYASSYLGLLAALDPDITGSAAKRAQYCGYVASNINTFWQPLLSTPAGYGQNFFIINQSYPNYGFEVEPWQLAITATGFRDAYRAASGVCTDPATAANAKSLIARTLDYMYSYGAIGTRVIPAANGGGTGRVGMSYLIGAPATGEIPHEPCTGAAAQALLPCIGGTVSGVSGSATLIGDSHTFTGTLAAGSATVSGVSSLTGVLTGEKIAAAGIPAGALISSINASTHVITMSANATASGRQSITASTNFVSGGVFKCNGTDFVGIWTESPPTVHRIASCADDTHMTLAASDPLVSNVTSSLFAESYVDGANDCSPSRSKYCFGGTNPDNSTDSSGIFGWYYALTGEPQWLTWGDDLFSSWAGGPAGGPGASGPPAGPMASGQTTGAYGYLTALPPCNLAAPPCGGATNPGSTPIHWGRDFGIASGWAGAADNYFAYRIIKADR